MPMTFQKEFMLEAIQLAKEKMEAGFGGPFGCVIVKDGRVVGRGYNQVTSSNDPTAHAEVSAIRDACSNLNTYQLEGCELYTSCEPCPMCLGAIYWARPTKVYYACTKSDAAEAGFDDDFIYEEIKLKPNERRIPMEQFLPSEGLAAFKAWKAKADKKAY